MQKLNQGSAFDLLYNLGNKAQCLLLPFPWELLSFSLSFSESHIKIRVNTKKGLCALPAQSSSLPWHWACSTLWLIHMAWIQAVFSRASQLLCSSTCLVPLPSWLDQEAQCWSHAWTCCSDLWTACSYTSFPTGLISEVISGCASQSCTYAQQAQCARELLWVLFNCKK